MQKNRIAWKAAVLLRVCINFIACSCLFSDFNMYSYIGVLNVIGSRQRSGSGFNFVVRFR